MYNIPNIVVNSPSSSNRVSLMLLDKGTPLDLSSVTAMELVLPNGNVVSSIQEDTVFEWKNTGINGIVRLFLGRLSNRSPFIQAETYECQFVIYDPLNSLGAFMGYVRILAI